MMQFYAISKLDNGNITFTDTRNMTIVRIFNPNASIERLDDNRIKITNSIGQNNGFVFDYRKIDAPACNPYIETDNIDIVIHYLSINFFFLDKAEGNTKILNYSYDGIGSIPSYTGWRSENTELNKNVTQSNRGKFNPIPDFENQYFSYSNLAFLGYHGVYHNALSEDSYIKKIIIDLDLENVSTSTDFAFCLHQHQLKASSKTPNDSNRQQPINHRKILYYNVGTLVNKTKFRRIFHFKKNDVTFLNEETPIENTINKDARIALLIKCKNDIDNQIFTRINIEIEIEKI